MGNQGNLRDEETRAAMGTNSAGCQQAIPTAFFPISRKPFLTPRQTSWSRRCGEHASLIKIVDSFLDNNSDLLLPKKEFLSALLDFGKFFMTKIMNFPSPRSCTLSMPPVIPGIEDVDF